MAAFSNTCDGRNIFRCPATTGNQAIDSLGPLLKTSLVTVDTLFGGIQKSDMFV